MILHSRKIKGDSADVVFYGDFEDWLDLAAGEGVGAAEKEDIACWMLARIDGSILLYEGLIDKVVFPNQPMEGAQKNANSIFLMEKAGSQVGHQLLSGVWHQ